VINTFQISVKINSMGIYQFILDEGSSATILSSSAWKSLVCPKLVSSTSELLALNRRPSKFLGILHQLHITLGGNIILVDLLVIPGPLEFNMLLGRDYVNVMNFVVSTLFCVMHFPHNRSIITIDKLSSDNHHHMFTLAHVSPLIISS
jgi:hypothetical protein